MRPGFVPVFALVRTPVRVFAALIALSLLATACGGDVQATVDASVSTTPHAARTDCTDAFVAHDLDHLTKGPGNTASTFDGTGAGVGVHDLDDDGDLDIVLANLSDSPSILENLGGLDFERHGLENGRFRGVSLVDVTADGLVDIVLSTGIGPPVLYENGGTFDSFERIRLEGVRAATYSMAWSDLGGDGDLDLVTGSYNAELTLLRNSPVIGEDTGVVLHERNDDGSFAVTRLSETAQALALITTDVNGDGTRDILVGNDLATPDMIWLDTSDGWVATMPFTTSSYSTMSFDAADIDNDGRNELFSTDMKPVATPDDRYREVEADLAAAPVVDDIQEPENVLNDPSGDGFTNMAAGQAVAATGWSWAGLFGDLDNDGLQDLYVATGMRSDQLFDFLPEARLVEENQAFANREGILEPAPQWGLGDTDGGRGMTMADMDGDGDLDIVLNNLDAPARLYENQLCAGGALTVELEWAGEQNIDAFGSTIRATSGNVTQLREITSSRGYLSSAPPIAHFGLADDSSIDLEIVWPDGASTKISDLSPGTHVSVTR